MKTLLKSSMNFPCAFVFVIALVVSQSTRLSAQAGASSVKLNMTLTNNHGLSTPLSAGVHEFATDGLDIQLNESELPPVPPVEIFDCRFVGPTSAVDLGEGSLMDLRPWRSGGSTFTETFRITFQAGRTWPSVTLLMPSSFPSQIKQVKVDGQAVNAGDSVVSQFASGDFTLAVDFNLTPVTLSVNPNVITFTVSDHDSIVPPPQTVQISADVSGASWYAETEQGWIELGQTRGAGTTDVSVGLSNLSFFEGRTTGEVRFYHSHDDDPVIVTVNVDMLTDVTPLAELSSFTLGRNYPNPFRRSDVSSTVIEFSLEKSGAVRLAIYDVLGRLIQTLVDGSLYSSGTYTVQWDGRNSAGEYSAPGVYLYRLEFLGSSQSNTLMVH